MRARYETDTIDDNKEDQSDQRADMEIELRQLLEDLTAKL